jgi:hypothetical protein
MKRWQQLVCCRVADGGLIGDQEVRKTLPDLPAIVELQGAEAT